MQVLSQKPAVAAVPAVPAIEAQPERYTVEITQDEADKVRALLGGIVPNYGGVESSTLFHAFVGISRMTYRLRVADGMAYLRKA